MAVHPGSGMATSMLRALQHQLLQLLPSLLPANKLPKSIQPGGFGGDSTAAASSRRGPRKAGTLASQESSTKRRQGFDSSNAGGSSSSFGGESSLADEEGGGEDIFDFDAEAELLIPEPATSRDEHESSTTEQQKDFQSFQYYTPLNASLAPLLAEYISLSAQQKPLGNSTFLPEAEAALQQSELESAATCDLQGPGKPNNALTFDPANFNHAHHESSARKLLASPKVYETALRVKRITPEVPAAFKLDNIQSLISSQPRVALEKLEVFANYDRKSLDFIRRQSPPPGLCKLIVPRHTTFPIQMPALNEIIFTDGSTFATPAEGDSLRFAETRLGSGGASIARPLYELQSHLPGERMDAASELDRLAAQASTPQLFELLCQLYFDHDPESLLAFVDMVSKSFTDVEATLKAKQAPLATAAADQPADLPPLSRSFYARAVDAIPPVDVYCFSEDFFSPSQLASYLTLLDRDEKCSTVLRFLLELPVEGYFQQAIQYIRSKQSLPNSDILQTELTQMLLCHCVAHSAEYSEEDFSVVWSLLPTQKLNALDVLDTITQCYHQRQASSDLNETKEYFKANLREPPSPQRPRTANGGLSFAQLSSQLLLRLQQ